MTSLPFWIQSKLRRLDFKETWGTEIRRMRAELETYPEIELVLQEADQAFQVQFVRKEDQERQDAQDDVLDGNTTEVALLRVMRGDMTRGQIHNALGLKNDEHFRKAYSAPAIEAGLVEVTIPDKPRSSKQRYRLTAKGMRLKSEESEKP